LQVPTSINVVVHQWKPLHSIIQYCICNIRPFLHLYDFSNVICWTWCNPRLRSIIDNILKNEPPPSPYLPPQVAKELCNLLSWTFKWLLSIPCL
jgi:hypothetical protein